MAAIRRFLPTLTLAIALTAIAILLTAAPHPAAAEPLPLPRFAALQSSKVNLRAGPGESYPVQWVYQRAGMPVEIIEEFDVWRKIRDHDGIVGWVRGTLLTGKRNAIITDQRRNLRSSAEEAAAIVAILEPGVIARILECSGLWCRLEIQGHKGWLRKDEIWGVYPDETIEP